MKKLICLLLTLSLLCAGIALAENTIDPSNPSQNTTVTFDIPEPQTDYTVTIPASVAFAGSAATTLTMELTESTDDKTAGDYSDTLTFKLSVTG